MTRGTNGSNQKSDPVRTITTIIFAIVAVLAGLFTAFNGNNNPATPTPVPATLFATNAPPNTLPEVPTSAPPVTLPEMTNLPAPTASGGNIPIPMTNGYGASKGFWQVFFTIPMPRGSTNYVGGIDTQLAAAIDRTQRTLDIAAFEFNNPLLTQAILNAKTRGVTIRIVTDNVNGTQDTADLSLGQFKAAGIPVIDDGRQALMHDKFMILDSTVVWTGSWNYTINDTYRNNNNAIALRSRKVVEDYQAEFNEMFERRQFGPRSPSNTPNVSFSQDGTPIQIYYGAEDEVVPALLNTLNQAHSQIYFMAFSFTLAELGDMLKTKAAQGIQVQGIFETTGSETKFAQLTPLFCAGLAVRQDGNPYVLHHKVFIVDNQTVVAGSFNFSSSARDDNDENMFIISDPDLAAQYIAEFQRRWAEAKTPTSLRCS